MTDARNLSDPRERAALAKQIEKAIDAYCVKAYDDGHRNHLGASRIGNACSRALWYEFRWAHREQFDGRKLRLFNRGHREEARFIEWLRGAGFDIFDTEVDGKQIRIAAVNGHFGGSLDGVLSGWPTEFRIGEPFLLEFKTQGTGSGFTNLKANGVKKEKPEHFAQMSTYGKAKQLRYALYIAINKNDDDLHVEIVELDWNLAQANERKAEYIITTETAPPRISEASTDWRCKTCHFSPICHSGQAPEKNCRTCAFALPIENGQWGCRKFQQPIPQHIAPVGCEGYVRLF